MTHMTEVFYGPSDCPAQLSFDHTPVFFFSWLLCFTSVVSCSFPQSPSHTPSGFRGLFLCAEVKQSAERLPTAHAHEKIINLLFAAAEDVFSKAFRCSAFKLLMYMWPAAARHSQFSARHIQWRAHAFTTTNSHSRSFFIFPSRSLPLSLLCTLIQIYQNVAWPLMPQLTSCSMCFRLLLSDTKQL